MSLRKVFQKLLHIGVLSDWHADTKRLYRQVNAFNALVIAIAISGTLIAYLYKSSIGVYIQIASLLLYLTSYIFNSQGKIEIARRLTLYTFETHIFVVTFFAISEVDMIFINYTSSLFILYTIYPLVAILFDLRVLPHAATAVLQIIAIQFAGQFGFIMKLSKFSVLNYDSLNLIITFYTLIMVSIIGYWLYNENLKVKKEEARISKELTELNNTKDRLFSIISHDLRSPISTILGFTELILRSDNKNEQTDTYSKAIYDTAVKQHQLLENLLAWSKNQWKSDRVNKRKIDLSEIANDVAGDFSEWSKLKTINLDTRLGQNLFVWADEDQIRTVLRNLLSNALKFTLSGGVVSLILRQIESSCLIEVSDTGLGMEPEFAKSLLSNSTPQSSKGTHGEKGSGLGLQLCKEFVEKNGGEFQVESAPQKGTTFRFTLPLADNTIINCQL